MRFSLCEAHLDDWANGDSVDVFPRIVLILVLRGVKGKIQGSEMSAGLHSRNLILGMNFFTIPTLNV